MQSGGGSASQTNSTTGSRLYLVYYGQPIPQQYSGTRGGSSARPNISNKAYDEASEESKRVAHQLRGTTWEMRREGAQIPDEYVQPVAEDHLFADQRIAMQWTQCTQSDMDKMQNDSPDDKIMSPFYKFLHLNEYKLQVDADTPSEVVKSLTQGEWKIGTTAVGSLARKKTNYVLLTDTQFRCLNGAVLTSNSFMIKKNGDLERDFWQFEEKNEFDSHGIYSGSPLSLIMNEHKNNWSNNTDENTRALKFVATPDREVKDKESGEINLVNSGELQTQAGTKSAQIRYATVEADEVPMFTMDGMWMVSMIELPVLEKTVQKTYGYGNQCIFCLSEPSTCRATPCQHYFACQNCVQLVPKGALLQCPLCRQQVACMQCTDEHENVFTEERISYPPLHLKTENVMMAVVTRPQNYAWALKSGGMLYDESKNAKIISHSDYTIDSTDSSKSRVLYRVPPNVLIYVQITNLSHDHQLGIQFYYRPDDGERTDKQMQIVNINGTVYAPFHLKKGENEGIDGWDLCFFNPNLCSTSQVNVLFQLQ